MDNKQTAVEWLIDKVEDHYCLLPVDLIEQAKAMEKEQMIKSFNEGTFAQDEKTTAEQYYTETFNQTTMVKIIAFSLFAVITLLSAFSMACVLLYENPTCITFIVASFALCVALMSIFKIIKHL